MGLKCAGRCQDREIVARIRQEGKDKTRISERKDDFW